MWSAIGADLAYRSAKVIKPATTMAEARRHGFDRCLYAVVLGEGRCIGEALG